MKLCFEGNYSYYVGKRTQGEKILKLKKNKENICNDLNIFEWYTYSNKTKISFIFSANSKQKAKQR